MNEAATGHLIALRNCIVFDIAALFCTAFAISMIPKARTNLGE
jgi:hypothetical protein